MCDWCSTALNINHARAHTRTQTHACTIIFCYFFLSRWSLFRMISSHSMNLHCYRKLTLCSDCFENWVTNLVWINVPIWSDYSGLIFPCMNTLLYNYVLRAEPVEMEYFDGMENTSHSGSNQYQMKLASQARIRSSVHSIKKHFFHKRLCWRFN